MTWSIFIQVVGALYYPLGAFCCVPTGLWDDPSRLWNWGDMEIFRDFNAGPYPVDPLGTIIRINKGIEQAIWPVHLWPFLCCDD